MLVIKLMLLTEFEVENITMNWNCLLAEKG